ncbi:MAG: MG2 domain-containing protein, partial [Flavobacteriales bacterium]
MKKLISCLIAISIIFSCGKGVKEEVSNNQAFSSFISAYTAGMISKESAIRIKLTESIGDEIDLTKPLDKKVFKFSPSLDGETRWIDNRTLEFIPKNGLKAGTTYTANFNLSELKKVPKELSVFVFNFRTIAQNFEVTHYGLSTPSQSNRGIQNLNGIISFADFVDSVSVKKGFSAVQGGKELPIEFIELPNNEYRFDIRDIKRGLKKDSKLEIEFNGTAVGIDKDYKTEINVYSQQSFKVTHTDVIHSPEQYVIIHFSDPLKTNQNLKGLVLVNNAPAKEYVIDGHDLKVYMPNQLNGTKELIVFKGVKNIDGIKLRSRYSKELTFEAIKPNVKEYGDGVIIPSDGKMNFPFEAVNLKAVDIVLTKIHENNLLQFFQVNNFDSDNQLKRVGNKVLTKKLDLTKSGVRLDVWNRFSIDLSSVIDKNEGAIYQIHIRFKKEYSNYKCHDAKKEEDEDMEELSYESNEKEWSESDWGTYDYDYYDDYDYYEYEYSYSERNNPCHSMYYRNKGVTKNIILSDIGLIAKAGSDKVLHVIANDINTTAPMSGVNLDIYNFQQQLIATVGTDGEGMASIQLDEKPFVVVASIGSQRGYIKLRDGESLSLSKFDVSGATIQKGIKGFMYGERGVWRPGDSIYLSFMLEDKNQILPQNHPVEFTLHNPKNQLVYRKVRTNSVNGIYDFRTGTAKEALTGNYRAQVRVGNRKFVKYIKVETVKPNRLKVKLETEAEYISQRNNTEIELNATWLHGSPANKLKAKVDVSIDQAGTRFDKFKGYQFDDPLKRYNSNDFTVFESRLDAEGKAKFPLKLSIPKASPGMLNAHFTTKVFEEGGGFSINRKSMKYSPFTSYVGVKVPKGTLYSGTLEINKTHKFSFGTVTEKGKPMSNSISVKIYKINWRYWWDRYDSDLARYITGTSVEPLVKKQIKTAKGKATLNFKPTKWGRYLITVKDLKSGHTTGKVFYADERYWSRSNKTDKEFETMLAFSTDKEVYEVGNEVKYSFPSKSGG